MGLTQLLIKVIELEMEAINIRRLKQMDISILLRLVFINFTTKKAIFTVLVC